MSDASTSRRSFLRQLAVAAGAVVLMPRVTACGGSGAATAEPGGPSSRPTLATDGSAAVPVPVPRTQPDGWDPVEFNRARGNAGAIPESYLGDINGPDGDWDHLGKHLPWFPELDPALVPAGYVGIMWGDPDKGHTPHPNAPRGPANNHEGHWYNWIRVRKATDEEAQELQSTYTDWPGTNPDDSGAYAVHGGGEITDNAGKNTIYLAAVPPDVRPGDLVRIYAHCLTHGEYVDFVRYRG